MLITIGFGELQVAGITDPGYNTDLEAGLFWAVRVIVAGIDDPGFHSPFFDEISLFTRALVDFSKRIPHALSTINVTTKINRNDQADIGRIRSPSQIT